MNRTALVAASALIAACALPGCIFVDGSSDYSGYKGYGSTTKAQLDEVVAANTRNRVGESQDVVLGRFPTEHISLVDTFAEPDGSSMSVYRVFAREKSRGTRFERYFVFQNDALVLLTDDEDKVEERFGHHDHD